jgi:DNA invertase Pin-like site-specific DNA recombinase
MSTTSTSQEKIKAVIYCRVSTKEQADEGNSLVTQEKVCLELAYKLGYTPDEIKVFIERGESAKTVDRTELKKLLRLCSLKNSGIELLIIYKIDRLSRNIADYSQIKILLKKYGVEIKSAREQLENTPVGRFMENTMINVAQFDNEIRADRCKDGMIDAVREGRYVWGAPVGYKNGTVNGKPNLECNEMSEKVLATFELVAQNLYDTNEVWRRATKLGLRLKNGKPLSRGYFHSMLRNRIYTAWIDKFGYRCTSCTRSQKRI